MLSNVLAETRDRSAYILLMNKSRKSCRKLRLFFCALDTVRRAVRVVGPYFYGATACEGKVVRSTKGGRAKFDAPSGVRVVVGVQPRSGWDRRSRSRIGGPPPTVILSVSEGSRYA